MQNVNGKKILITGAAMGMGKLYARLAVLEGAAAVVIWDINTVELEKTAAELTALAGPAGTRIEAFVVDVSRLEAIVESAEKVRAAVGAIDILINNAGIVRGQYFWLHHQMKDTWMTMAINALAPMYITREFIPAMIANTDGECRIVNIASAAGTLSNPKMSVYCASKWAVIGWSDSVRLELEQAGYPHVKVTTVCPSYVATGMFAGAKGPLLTPLLAPDDVVKRVWAAMKIGKPMLMMPWTVKLASICKGVLPLWLWDWVADKIFGVYKTMDEFKGRNY
ncbi:MAG: SDR family oxidoreductase [Nevskia sp.]|jgi:short-subunit dehydrogenase|nr:SDR family oxidoreductase [Nevskia sp.]MCK9384436.1 SDR family oxidoreductase [Nevskia sp.]